MKFVFLFVLLFSSLSYGENPETFDISVGRRIYSIPFFPLYQDGKPHISYKENFEKLPLERQEAFLNERRETLTKYVKVLSRIDLRKFLLGRGNTQVITGELSNFEPEKSMAVSFIESSLKSIDVHNWGKLHSSETNIKIKSVMIGFTGGMVFGKHGFYGLLGIGIDIFKNPETNKLRFRAFLQKESQNPAILPNFTFEASVSPRFYVISKVDPNAELSGISTVAFGSLGKITMSDGWGYSFGPRINLITLGLATTAGYATYYDMPLLASISGTMYTILALTTKTTIVNTNTQRKLLSLPNYKEQFMSLKGWILGKAKYSSLKCSALFSK